MLWLLREFIFINTSSLSKLRQTQTGTDTTAFFINFSQIGEYVSMSLCCVLSWAMEPLFHIIDGNSIKTHLYYPISSSFPHKCVGNVQV